MIFIDKQKNLKLDLVKIEDWKIDKIMKTKINFPEYKVDMAKILLPMMEYVHIVEELIKNKISRASNNRFSKILMKEFSSEEP